MPDTSANEAALRLLETRRSVPTAMLGEPAPTPPELNRIFTIALRVPDHGNLQPWRLLVFAGDARHTVGQQLSDVYRAEKAEMAPEKREKFAGIMARVFTYAPMVVLVVSSPDPTARITLREQEASAGAVAMNLLNAVAATGYGANLVTGWAAESQGAATIFGLAEHEHVVGIVHIGTPTEPPTDRPRPTLAERVSYWGDQ